MAFYEFTDDENAVFQGLSLRMNIAGVLMVIFGIGLIVFSALDDRIEFVTFLLLAINGLILGVIGFLTFQSSKRFRKIIETQGHDIMYLMEAMAFQTRVYTLIVVLVAVSTLAMIASALFVQSA